MPATEELNTTTMTTARPASDSGFFLLSLRVYPSFFRIKIKSQICSSHGHRASLGSSEDRLRSH
ncbi:hypothetical protein RchiOBHm_Chr1g0342081 [Rosa chinensis]|uniref:Uncharacterized protein n=1 Tax=Rosa chinensis TaxID=74649 RepID=A0A2P6SDX9_ROSCH|nr:hypothetical protein RchiOBHm_Chr1g0342081 [Rosa chinensis]